MTAWVPPTVSLHPCRSYLEALHGLRVRIRVEANRDLVLHGQRETLEHGGRLALVRQEDEQQPPLLSRRGHGVVRSHGVELESRVGQRVGGLLQRARRLVALEATRVTVCEWVGGCVWVRLVVDPWKGKARSRYKYC